MVAKGIRTLISAFGGHIPPKLIFVSVGVGTLLGISNSVGSLSAGLTNSS